MPPHSNTMLTAIALIAAALGTANAESSVRRGAVEAPVEIRGASFDLALLAAAPASQGSSTAAGTPAVGAAINQLVQPVRPVKQQPMAVAAFVKSVYDTVVEPKVALTLYNVNTRQLETFNFTYDGQVDEDQAKALKYFFRCRRTGRRRNISPQTLSLLVDIGRRFPGHTIEIVSGYRAPPYGVRNSRHFHGAAIDLRVQGVKIVDVRDYVWSNHTNGIGVGYYRGQDFIHIDTRPGRNDAAWTSPRRNARYRNNPKWSRKPRAIDLPPVEDMGVTTSADDDHAHASL